ncbi:substrate-binding domain-containing protein [Sedimentibacter sp. MB31-C6]|uniref:substrate-binding domain-containing protein n=1 Tax=Sedimentibacter sp. MB31-C6 TaxID=3109366 RepID=UPI002DDD6E74|nr:substrate-binding domain-containing protein [Sedimentibacter sp. MB36-C1]WSI03350.1 substrate-binding domain-containing protein [Sedimentibacter sp. MB36-C1]
MKKSKVLSIFISILLLSLVFVGCSQAEKQEKEGFDYNKEITVVARDAASGTRGAFHELMGIIQKEGDTEVDKLVVGALEFDGTDKVITAVEGDKFGIGYISLGSVSNRIKAASVDKVEPTVENVKNGNYSVARPFLLVTKGEESDLVRDFLSFAESTQGQDITNEMNFIGAADSPIEYSASGMSGIIKVAGSTSVTPLMEKLQEAYTELNPDVKFEMQSNGSSQGIKAAIDESYDIGMASRELKEEEAGQLNRYVLAIDGIAVIINNENPIDDISSESITNIYTGEITKWSEVK